MAMARRQPWPPLRYFGAEAGPQRAEYPQPADSPSLSRRALRVRISRQVAYHINGSIVSLIPEEVLRLSVFDFYKIVVHLDSNDGLPGKIIRPGDGIGKAITPGADLWRY
jgi:hypothetical protein